MAFFRIIVLTAVLAGLVAGLFLSLSQQVGTVPLILRAEAYERGVEAPGAAGQASLAEHEHGSPDGEAWAPQDGLERAVFTIIADVLTGIGFALLLVAGYALRGRAIDWREGLLWGGAGFAAFALAPSLGLPPELPGMPAASLGPRQLWWVATAVATAAGLGLLAFRPSLVGMLAAVALLALPHLLGAPQPTETDTPVPETLARSFVIAVTITNLLFWTLLGVLTALLFERLAAGRDLSPAAWRSR